MKNIATIAGTLLLIVSVAAACAANTASTTQIETVAATPAAATVAADTTAASTDAASTGAASTGAAATVVEHVSADSAAWESAAATTITLDGSSITVAGEGVTVEGSQATITAAGVYNLSGALADGQIVVDTGDEAPVYLILNGVELSSSTSAPLFISKAEEVVIVLADGAQNFLTDGSAYVYASAEEDEPNAALFSKANLTLTGSGALTVQGNYNDGIASKDGLLIDGGVITLDAIGSASRRESV